MPHAETSAHRGAAGNVQLGRNAVHGVRVVSMMNVICPLCKWNPRRRDATPVRWFRILGDAVCLSCNK